MPAPEPIASASQTRPETRTETRTETGAPAATPSESERWRSLAERCRSEGLTESLVEEVVALGPRAVDAARAIHGTYGVEAGVFVRALIAFAGLGRANPELADAVITMPEGEAALTAGAPPELQLLERAMRLYRACYGAGHDPQPVDAMNALMQALGAAEQAAAAPAIRPELLLARGYAGLTLGEALLRVGDVGAARNQLEVVADELNMPAGIAVVARMLLGGIELAVGRADLALSHAQVALHRAAALGPTSDEERLMRMVLMLMLFGDNRRFGLAMLDDVSAGKYGPVATGQGTVARLYRLLQMLAHAAGPLGLPARAALHAELRWLKSRHRSAGWALLVTSLCAAALYGAGDPCEAYGVLVRSAAELRVQRMDGAADLCDRQIAALRVQLGAEPDRFDELLTEAQRRRRELAAFEHQSGDAP